MGRLENIIARNRRGGRPRERTVTMLVFGVCLLVIVGLLLFTNLGLPDEARAPAHEPRDRAAHDIKLR